ncbi:putative carboxylesterase 12 [Acorus calamus]|uniref:Carboxylesterase 12 n=1 Tax=Acorus calamus TaxID=4465 RepID=A0AAV9FGR7_ACOCL|nr:putative carboxylesterase 12 [Acorus calamus]
MASTDLTKEVEFDLSPYFKIYKDGTIERLLFTDSVPPSFDDQTRVSSKDVIVSADTGVSARLYLPKLKKPDVKLPLVVYFHGGGFCIASTAASIYHSYLNHLSAQAHVFIMSVDYRRPTGHPLPHRVKRFMGRA